MNNEEKILQILSQMQGDVQALKQDVALVRGAVAVIEQEHGKKLDAIFDGYKANYEIISNYDPRVTRLEREVERLSFELQYLKAAK